jgi:hypothetical protein
MRSIAATLGTSAFAFGAVLAGEALAVSPGQETCSVFDRHPCAPTVCSVFRRRPCRPEFEPPIGQDLRLTIRSDETERARRTNEQGGADHELDTIAALFAALRGCWMPPAAAELPPDMQMSVRLSFKRNGQMIGAPRVTYVSAGASRKSREQFHTAIIAALHRCQPLPFTSGFGGAVAGRPIAIRFIENGTLQTEKP